MAKYKNKGFRCQVSGVRGQRPEIRGQKSETSYRVHRLISVFCFLTSIFCVPRRSSKSEDGSSVF